MLLCGPATFWCWGSCGALPAWPSSCQTCSSSTQKHKEVLNLIIAPLTLKTFVAIFYQGPLLFLAPSALWDLCHCVTVSYLLLDCGWYWFAPVNPSKISVNTVRVNGFSTAGWPQAEVNLMNYTMFPQRITDNPRRPLRANSRRTHCFHGGDEVHGFLVDFLLQETESLVVEDEADGCTTKNSKEWDSELNVYILRKTFNLKITGYSFLHTCKSQLLICFLYS